MDKIRELEKRIATLENNSLSNIILNSQYYCIGFAGTADNTNLSKRFDDSILKNKRMLIKSVRLIPFAQVETQELYNNTSGDVFTIPASARINKSIDDITQGAKISIIINGTEINLFTSTSLNNNQSHPFDLFCDNIYFNQKSVVSSIDVRINGQLFIDLLTPATGIPLIKVFIELYVYG